MKLRILVILIFFYRFSVAQVFHTDNGKVVFLSKAPLSTFEGKSEKLKGLIDLEKNLVDFYLDLNTLQTGINLRDKHMRDNYLETKKYPFAEFTGKIVTPEPSTLFSSGETTEVTAQGIFKLHGVEKNMEVKGILRREGEQLLLTASFSVLLSDFNIEKPSLVVYELADEQKVTIDVVLSKKN